MHIPDGFLSPSVASLTWTAAAVGVAAALRAERRDPQPAPAGTLGAAGAFLFAAQLINVPVAPGTSGHLVGATLAALLLGPWRALLVMTVVLTVQAFLFQDGGLTSLGANILDMGVAGVFAGYAIATVTARWIYGPRGCVAGGVLGAFGASLAGAMLTAVWLGLSGLYPLAAIVPLMLVTHVAIGLLEAALTGAVLVTVVRWRPDLVRALGLAGHITNRVAFTLGVLAFAVALGGFVAPFASSLPDGLEFLAERLGFFGRAHATWPAPFSGYSLPWISPSRIGTALAGVMGALMAAAIAWGVSRSLQGSHDTVHR